MRRRAVRERIQQETELLARLFIAQTDHLEDLLLNLRIVETNRASRDFEPVQHEVVAIAKRLAGVAREQPDALVVWAREDVVRGFPALLLLVALEQRRVDDPEEVPFAAGDEVEVAGDLLPELAEGLRRDVVVVGREEDDTG